MIGVSPHRHVMDTIFRLLDCYRMKVVFESDHTIHTQAISLICYTELVRPDRCAQGLKSISQIEKQ